MELQNTKQNITSLELAELTGKRHDHLLASIKKMEESWQELGLPSFRESSYKNKQNREMPMYLLSKTESLYVASKFNDKLRAKVILRWKELEEQQHQPSNLSRMDILQIAMNAEKEKLALEKEVKQLKPKADYTDQVLTTKNTWTTTVIAKQLGMSAQKLNKKLQTLGVIYQNRGVWVLYSKYQGKGYTKMSTHIYENSKGEQCSNLLTEWTEKGRQFIHQIVTEPLRLAV